MKKILILFVSLSFLSNIHCMDKDIMRSMDDNQHHNQNQSIWSDNLPNELKQEILKFIISSYLESRKFNIQTYKKIIDLKLIHTNSNNIINTFDFLEHLRKYINDSYTIPICKLALAKMILTSDQYKKIMDITQNLGLPQDLFYLSDQDFENQLSKYILEGRRLDLPLGQSPYSVLYLAQWETQNKKLINYLIKAGAHINEKDAIQIPLLSNNMEAVQSLLEANIHFLPKNVLSVTSPLFMLTHVYWGNVNHENLIAFRKESLDKIRLLLTNKHEFTESEYEQMVRSYQYAVKNNDLELQELLYPYMTFFEVAKSSLPSCTII